VTSPPRGKLAKPLDPDVLAWERQPNESHEAYTTFRAWLDSDERKVNDREKWGPNAGRWSAEWSWGFRAFEYDRFVSAEEAKALIRYRSKMNERHRAIARTGLAKVADWLLSCDVAKMKPAEVARFLEVASRLERDAAGAHVSLPESVPDDAFAEEITLAELFGTDPAREAELADVLYEMQLAGRDSASGS
jgi:hypothetical protein